MILTGPSTQMAKATTVLFIVAVVLLDIHEACGCYRRKPARIKAIRLTTYLEWSSWSGCSVTCGKGNKNRIRRCASKGFCEYVKETEMKECSVGKCKGDSTVWSAWSPCSSTCGPPGFTQRSNGCTRDNCTLVLQKKKCQPKPCPVNGGWSTWGRWGACSATCGLGKRQRIRKCNQPVPQHGGAGCGDYSREMSTCELREFCHDPVDGGWSKWTEYSRCSLTCGIGTKSRKRTCTNPTPAYGGKSCGAKSMETVSCELNKYCGPTVHGGWGQWQSWTVCSARCGSGERNRVRLCDSPSPANGGRQCPGMATQIEACFNKCPVNGGWSPWQVIHRCTSIRKRPCSLGREAAIRKCNNPAPAFDGLNCSGLPSRVIECWDDTGCPKGLQKPLDFKTQAYSNKSVLVRWREAPYGQRPTNFLVYYKAAGEAEPMSVMGPREIPGANSPPDGVRYFRELRLAGKEGRVEIWVEAQRITKAETQRHAVAVGETDGGWSAWTHFTDCSVTCGIGMRTRRRSCDNPMPSSRGRPCPGKRSEVQQCDSGEFCR